jgi:hypothetical protein
MAETKENENKKYLYGASVQGIQDFIFQTNELKNIIGASGLVEKICKETFDEYVKNGHLIVEAAGKIKCMYTSESECEYAVKNFPKRVMEMAPGIIITQAVVELGSNSEDAVDKLEEYLKIQRNKPAHSLLLGLMGIARSRRTGLPAVERDGISYIDEPTSKKHAEKKSVKTLCKNCLGDEVDYAKITFDIDKMTDKNDWIAIIHADGNGFGKITQSIGNDIDELKSFSKKLDNITKKAAQKAFAKLGISTNKNIPFRPIILGGDDLTIICRADLAIKYTNEFLTKFEKESKLLKNELESAGLSKLTMCAGIAFIKSSYPFYYGYDLAEQLCRHAKKEAKDNPVDGLAPSCLMFHKVQDSFVEDFDEIVKRELTPNTDISFKYGPYYLHDGCGKEKTVEFLLRKSEKLKNDKEGNAIKSHLRQWITLLSTNPEMAKQKAIRMKTIFNNDEFIDVVTSIKNGATPAYDILSLHSVIYQETKNQNRGNDKDENN